MLAPTLPGDWCSTPEASPDRTPRPRPLRSRRSEYRPFPLSLVAIAGCLLLLGLGACGGAVFSAKDIRFTLGDTSVVVLENGAIVIDKERVGEVRPDGKIVTRDGTLVMWIRDANIRLRGGATIPINTDQDGTMYLSVTAQEGAGLRPMTRRIRPDGTLAVTERSRGLDVRGATTPNNRRIVLGVLVALENRMWK